MSAIKTFEVSITSGHFDITSLSLEGEYNQKDLAEVKSENPQEEKRRGEEEELKPIRITYGYSKDKRSDLKQFVIGLVTKVEAGIPLMITVGDGNESDSKHNHRMMKTFVNLWQEEEMNFFVMDSAGYTPANLKTDWGLINWITRVPATIKEAKELLQNSKEKDFIVNDEDQRYKWLSVTREYGGVKQRCLIVQSQPRLESDWKKLEKDIEREKKKKEK